MSDVKYAELSSIWYNVGEEIQWLAQERFLPSVDYHVDKFRISDFHPDFPTKLIINGHFPHSLKRMVTDSNVDPLLVSIHIAPPAYRETQKKLVRDFFLEHGPVGCRDIATRDFLIELGIPAYFSGCLTLTLQRNPRISKNDYVLCVGLTDEEIEVVKKRSAHKVIRSDRLVPMIYGRETRMDIARAFLALYQGAHCVVTKMLHVALPCLALETPVLCVEHDWNLPEKEGKRFVGNLELLNHMTSDEFLSDANGYDFDSPPENPIAYKTLRDELIVKCSAFTGFCNPGSSLTITDPLPFLVEILSREKFYRKDSWREIYRIGRKRMIVETWNRFVLNRHLYETFPW